MIDSLLKSSNSSLIFHRFCPFPQHLTLRLTEGFHRIFKIQILLHHYKIPTRLELLVAKNGKTNEFEKLG